MLWRGYCPASFQSFVLRHLVIAPVCNSKELSVFLRKKVTFPLCLEMKNMREKSIKKL